MAREAFVKLMANDAAVATSIRNLAADELGVQPSAVPPGLMKDFLERKVPIADHRMLTFIGYFAAAAWEKSRLSNNEELEAWASRLMLFVEQTALQDGRTQLSWLLTGLGEPSWGLLTRRKSTLRPFARLCPATWVSANVAFLKEMDFIGAKLAPAGPRAPEPAKDSDNQAAAEKPPRKPPRRPRGGAGADGPAA